MHVLLVGDELGISDCLLRGLRQQGYGVAQARTGAQALKVHEQMDLVLLDLQLPDIDGLEVCRSIRAVSDTPIISFTSEPSELVRVLGLQAGSDDCLDKPYGFRELVARIDAVMRRAGGIAERMKMVEHGALRINAATREVQLAGRTIETSRKEFELLYYLASNPGVVVSRRRLMAEIWGDPMRNYPAGSAVSRTIDTHVSILRRKLGSSAWIRTVRGVGFTFTGEIAASPA
ncbi:MULTISPECIES: response regulator transcription factor [unclassified Streptomyces]|uniref:response regulator transcription factor n=1 Tax=unclassified Streptomyces TaxID=2593676 RepID=UPI00278C8E51|nr:MULTISPECIES: response regulator transcription factor [unclassified Streptomyces]